jgi:hypothetical protein
VKLLFDRARADVVPAIAANVLRIEPGRRSAVRRARALARRDLAQAREVLTTVRRFSNHIPSFPARGGGQTSGSAAYAREGRRMSLADYPGFPLLAEDVRELLLRVEDGDDAARPALLEKTADVLNVFIGLDLLQYVFMPSPEDDGSEPVTIDLIAPADPETAAIAWFSVDEAGYDEFRDAVTLFGDVADVLNPPIVLDIDDDAEETPSN